jgi:outer membrane protein insertion porin family
MLIVTSLATYGPSVSAQTSGVPTIVPPTPRGGSAPILPSQNVGPRVSTDGVKVLEVIVEGTQRIEPDTVRSYMTMKVGELFSNRKINDSLKTLFATHLFADVTIRRQGAIIIVQVVENPIINKIAFEQNKEIENDTLRSEVQLRPRIVFTRKRVQADVKRLLELYRRSGHFAAVIEPKVIQLPQNRVDLVFEIDEGNETSISRIVFVGNRFFSDKALRGVIQTKEDRWYRFFSDSDTFDPDRLTFDRELLRRYYLDNGFADFRVVSAIAELTADQKNFFVTFMIDEGNRYKIGKIEATSRIKEIQPEQLQPLIKIEPKSWYDVSKIDDAVIALTNFAGDRGFAFVKARPKVTRDRKKKSIDVVFELQEGPKVFLERINISGNVRTLDSVVRREFRLIEGDAFNATKLRRSRQRIQNLGYFGKVEISNLPGSDTDKTVIQVDLEEQSTGEVNLGFGFSTTEGGLIDAGINERNFLGRGQDIRAKFTLSQRSQNFDIGFTDPYFLERDVSAGVNLFKTERDNSNESSFTSKRLGVGFQLGYEINEEWKQSLRYVIRQDEIFEIDSDASLFIKAQEGESLTSLVGQSLTLDLRNSQQEPTDGALLNFFTDIAGLGGDEQYFLARISGHYYYQIATSWIVSFGGEIGHIQDFGEDIKINNRFFLGGTNLRGFEDSGASPRVSATDDALGGRTLFTGSVELGFPLGLPDELGFSGAMFTDFGALINPVEGGFGVLDATTPRISAGVGIKWRSPFGPIRFDVALPLIKEDFDKEEIVRFNLGTRF